MNHNSLKKLSPRELMKKFGTSYFWASLFFPKDIRSATQIIYRFVRIPDEYVDNPETTDQALSLLTHWKNEWDHAWNTHTSEQESIIDAVLIFKKYTIPKKLADDFIATMIQDTTISRYTTYQELQTYMHGSAMVIGEIMTHIIGYSSEKAFHYARILGEAMQWTNFLRDVGEDRSTRNRIYIPQEWYEKFGVTEQDIILGVHDEKWKHAMQDFIAHARKLFHEARKGIPLLHPRGRHAVYLSSIFYEKILDSIEKNHYDVFTKRARVSRIQRIMIILSSFFKY